MNTPAWSPSPNRYARYIQKTLLRTSLFVRRARGQQFQLRVRIGDHWIELHIEAARELQRAGDHHLESAMLDHIARSLRDDDIVYDVGANIGLISIVLALRDEGRACRFHAFEPEPRNHRQLTRNIELNAATDRIVPHRLALGDSDKDVELFVRGTAGEGRHSIASKRGAAGSIVVPMLPMSRFADSSAQPPDVVKIDVEGAEGAVLAGMDDMMKTTPPREIFMELHNKGLRDRMPDGSLVQTWLESRGYVRVWAQQRRSGVHCHFSTSVPR